MRFQNVFRGLVVAMLLGPAACHAADPPYNYRDSAQYAALDSLQRSRLDQVEADMQSLQTAIEKHMADHEGQAPETLESLVPRYLSELPRDPFARPDSTANQQDAHFASSLSGLGYLYRRRAGPATVKSWKPLTFYPTKDAWKIKSVGLRDFPLRYSPKSKNGRGLIRSQGYWGRLQLDIF